MTIRSLALPALALLALVPEGHAQREVETPVVKTSRPAAGTQGPTIDVVVGGAGDEDVELGVDDVSVKAGKVPGGKAVASVSIRRDLASFMSPIVGVKPRRVAPGQSGEVSIVLSMQPGYVLLPGQIDVAYARSNAAMEFGDWSIDDPKKGLAEGPFHGQPVYENYARITIPFTVSAEADMTKWAASFAITATVTDASSGASRGESQGHAATQIDVGPALPTPGVTLAGSGGSPGGQAPGVAAAAGAGTAGRAGTGANEAGRDPILAEVVDPLASDPSTSSSDPLPSPADMATSVSTSVNSIMLALGGLVVGVFALLLFGRGR
jgi:hypothetical protein